MFLGVAHGRMERYPKRCVARATRFYKYLYSQKKIMTLPTYPLTVKPEWIDHNGHMNVAYYVLVFDLATDAFYEKLGIGEAYYARDLSVYTLGMNVDYLHELVEGEKGIITTHLLDWDYKRVHYIHQMHHAETGVLVATNECLGCNVDQKVGRSVPFPDDVLPLIEQTHKAHQAVEPPSQVGRKLGIRRK